MGCRTTTFNGQANTVTLVASRTANQKVRIVASWLCQSNHRAGGLPLMWDVRQQD
jgi:hypothetical protein